MRRISAREVQSCQNNNSFEEIGVFSGSLDWFLRSLGYPLISRYFLLSLYSDLPHLSAAISHKCFATDCFNDAYRKPSPSQI